jgi:hypothetical protein
VIPQLYNQIDNYRLPVWDKCEERLLRIKSTPAPQNFLEEAAQLTDRGIMWHFPIDNEQGIDQEVSETITLGRLQLLVKEALVIKRFS